MLNTKSKKTDSKAAPAATKTADTATKGGKSKNKYDVQIAECRAIIEENKAKIKELLAKKLNEQSGDWEIGSTVYYPAPPQKNIIPCKLEIEEDSNGEIVYFARPICLDKKTGKETLSKRHYSLGTDLSECEDLYREPPKASKKDTSKKSAEKTTANKKTSKKEEPVEEKAPVKKATLGGKKTLGKKK